MKINEWFLTIFQIAVPIACFIFGMVPQGLFYSTWIVWFGFCEFMCKKFTGKTLSGHVWYKKINYKWYEKDKGRWVERPVWQRAVVGGLMVAGMVALAYHFIWGI